MQTKLTLTSALLLAAPLAAAYPSAHFSASSSTDVYTRAADGTLDPIDLALLYRRNPNVLVSDETAKKISVGAAGGRATMDIASNGALANHPVANACLRGVGGAIGACEGALAAARHTGPAQDYKPPTAAQLAPGKTDAQRKQAMSDWAGTTAVMLGDPAHKASAAKIGAAEGSAVNAVAKVGRVLGGGGAKKTRRDVVWEIYARDLYIEALLQARAEAADYGYDFEF